MVEAAVAASTPRKSRLDRRKARTRQALIDAAVRLIAEGRGERASIQEITDEADIGFGSFYNHFEGKEQLFHTASEEVLERWAKMIDDAGAGMADPAERFSMGLRISGRLGWTHPDIAGFLTGTGLGSLDIPSGLGALPCGTYRPGRRQGVSPSTTVRSRWAPWRAASSGSCVCTSATPNAPTKPPSTSSPRRCCDCSVSPQPRRPVLLPCHCLPPAPGDKQW